MTDPIRCAWARSANMHAYHDTEWGVPVHDDRKHFEFLILEGAQAGLSWSTILDKRAGYRRAFAGFDPEKVARFTPAKIDRLLADPGIVRNRLKLECAVGNARAYLKLAEQRGGFDAFLWGFVDGKPIVNRWKSTKQVPPRSKQSDAVAAELKRLGFKFAGSTIMYAHMQACGLVNDHLTGCFRWREVQREPRT
ncbi:MAG TPA: DNA-3-methyladenine glycosylase I [Kofleriaceae bacterium]|nr:DNA-3-methyladenine glycosylase I [Kofleriaceae bacterium]